MSNNPLLRRQATLEKVMPRFRDRPFAWGEADCIVLARAVLVGMRRKGVPALPRYRTERGAVLALRRMGARSLAELLDGIGLRRIAPATMLPGDLATVPGVDEETGAALALDCVAVSVGDKVLGWSPARPQGLSVIDTDAFTAAWTVL